MKKLVALLALACAFNAHAADKLIVGASPTPHAEILEKLKPMLAKDGVEVNI